MTLRVQPLTPERWPDLEAVFNARGCAVARSCWCMYYRESGAQPPRPPGQSLPQARRERMKALVEAGPPPGLIGYRAAKPVGWIALGPREHFAKLQKSPVMKPVDAQPVWSIICFVVPAEHRRQGVAAALLQAAVAWARRQGATLLEAYPVDKPGPAAGRSLGKSSR
ncbi:GNAT family N-acetyltransferase [Aquabacterium sp.]|uniref:GNAT family N-acetyltransferase n=1 Tax=Aquabacterium sp. TaxID=1872578 RepID=UPI00378314C2